MNKDKPLPNENTIEEPTEHASEPNYPDGNQDPHANFGIHEEDSK